MRSAKTCLNVGFVFISTSFFLFSQVTQADEINEVVDLETVGAILRAQDANSGEIAVQFLGIDRSHQPIIIELTPLPDPKDPAPETRLISAQLGSCVQLAHQALGTGTPGSYTFSMAIHSMGGSITNNVHSIKVDKGDFVSLSCHLELKNAVF